MIESVEHRKGETVDTPYGRGMVTGTQRVLWSDADFVYVVYIDGEFRHVEPEDVSRAG